jgi:predicted double-glycine peptidase
MSLKLVVPVMAQTQPCECWYVAACMVAYFYAAGPRLGVPRVWKESDKRGIRPTEFSELAQNEGLTPIVVAPVWSSKLLEQQLRSRGPIWCAGFWDGLGHVIVLSGVDAETVYFNDPAGGRRRSGTLNWFNTKLARTVPNCMLVAKIGSKR